MTSDLLTANGYMTVRENDQRPIVWLGDTYVSDKRTHQAIVLSDGGAFHAGYVHGDLYCMMHDHFGSIELAASCAATFMLEKCATVSRAGENYS